MIKNKTLITAVFAGSLIAVPALAVDFNWNVAGPADWSDGASWNPAGPPSGGGGNHAFINNGGTAVLSSDPLDIQDIFVGDNGGTGTLNQTGGNTFQGTGSWMFVGQDAGSVGTYNLSGGVQGKERLYVGQSGGTGNLNVFGTGSVQGALFYAGIDAGSSSTVNVSGNGEINVSDAVVFVNSTANFQDSAHVQAANNVQFENGTYTVTGNTTVKSGSEFWVGQNGGSNAVLNMDSGSVEADTWVAIGRNSSTGTVNLSGGEIRKTLIDDGLGTVANSEGSFIVLGGVGSGGSGTLNLSGTGTVWSDTGLYLNEAAGMQGTVNQTGGSVTVHDFAPMDFQPTYGASLHLDPVGDGQGQYNLSDGLLTTETVEVGGGDFNMTGGTLVTTTFNGDLTQEGGTLSPGASPGTSTINGNYDLFAAGDIKIELDGTAAGTEHDQVVVNGTATLAGALTLELINAYVPTVGDEFTILLNDDVDAVSGTFAGLGEGAVFSAGGSDFQITYVGGDGNDVVLTAIPEPSAMIVLLGGFAYLLVRRRRHA